VDTSDSSAERVRKLSDTEIHFYLVGHTLFGIGFGAAFARCFVAYSLPCAVGGMAVGVILMAIVWKAMLRRKGAGQG
jgi:Na+/citrate or Na+/malate symporter